MRLPYRAWLLIVFLVALGVSAIDPPHPKDFLFEHILTAAVVGWLVWLEFRGRGRGPGRVPGGPLSDVSYTLIFIYMMLHVLGARYTYSEVPYDRWAQAMFGVSVSELIGAGSYDAGGEARNHFDRLVHFLFGLLMVKPASELMQRWLGLPAGWRAVILAIGLLCVIGTVYELLEWVYAEAVGAEAAELYNGQQGDAFDAQKDVALNMAGSIIGGVIVGWRAKSRVKR